MASLLDTEGEIAVGIDTPTKAQRVTDGVENWLLKSGARDLRWAQDRLHFRGASMWVRRCSMSSVRYVGSSAIRFQNRSDKVVMTYTISHFQQPFWMIVATILPFAAAVGAPSLALCLGLVPFFLAFIYLLFRISAYGFRSELQLAAIRGLADGAAEELALLQSKSRSAGARAAAASPSGVFKSAASC
jgi:hypothetical protein